MIKHCEKCRKLYASWTVAQRFCKSCKKMDRYLRVAHQFTNAEVIADLASKGYHAAAMDPYDYRGDVVMLVPRERLKGPLALFIRHMSKRKGVFLVARGGFSGELTYIPTCRPQCVGCAKCLLAGALNGESSADARKRKSDPRGAWHKKRYVSRTGQKMQIKVVGNPCTEPIMGVHSQVEDID